MPHTASTTDCVHRVQLAPHLTLRVFFKGMRMAGRMGGDRVKLINLQVVKIISEKNIIVVKGAVPGPNNSYVKIERWS